MFRLRLVKFGRFLLILFMNLLSWSVANACRLVSPLFLQRRLHVTTIIIEAIVVSVFSHLHSLLLLPLNNHAFVVVCPFPVQIFQLHLLNKSFLQLLQQIISISTGDSLFYFLSFQAIALETLRKFCISLSWSFIIVKKLVSSFVACTSFRRA